MAGTGNSGTGERRLRRPGRLAAHRGPGRRPRHRAAVHRPVTHGLPQPVPGRTGHSRPGDAAGRRHRARGHRLPGRGRGGEPPGGPAAQPGRLVAEARYVPLGEGSAELALTVRDDSGGRAWAGSSWPSWPGGPGGPRRPGSSGCGPSSASATPRCCTSSYRRVGARRACGRLFHGLPGDLRDRRDAGLACGGHGAAGPGGTAGLVRHRPGRRAQGRGGRRAPLSRPGAAYGPGLPARHLRPLQARGGSGPHRASPACGRRGLRGRPRSAPAPLARAPGPVSRPAWSGMAPARHAWSGTAGEPAAPGRGTLDRAPRSRGPGWERAWISNCAAAAP